MYRSRSKFENIHRVFRQVHHKAGITTVPNASFSIASDRIEKHVRHDWRNMEGNHHNTSLPNEKKRKFHPHLEPFPELTHVFERSLSRQAPIFSDRNSVPVPQRKSLIQSKNMEGSRRYQHQSIVFQDEELKIAATAFDVKNNNADEQSSFPSDLIVVLDMDECLIHSQFLGNRWHQKPFESIHYDEIVEFYDDGKKCETFRIDLDQDNEENDVVMVYKRPHLDSFLREVTSKYETYVFTAAVEEYARPILDILDPHNHLKGRFYRNDCQHDTDLNVYVKDLQTVLNHRLKMNAEPSSRVVLVDNNPMSFLANPSNGVLVSNFYDDPHDDTLPAVLDLLNELEDVDDIQSHLDNKFGLRDALKDFNTK